MQFDRLVHVISKLANDKCCAAATPHNRKVFLACARRCLAPTAQAGRLSLGDVQSLLLLLCPDFPLATVKNAWSPAVAIQTCEHMGS